MAQPQVWDLWYPNAASQGLSFARGRLDETVVLLVHALPDAIRVEVRDDDGRLLASSDQLERTADRPMARLVRDGAAIRREDIWPGRRISAGRSSCPAVRSASSPPGGMPTTAPSGAGASSSTTIAEPSR